MSERESNSRNRTRGPAPRDSNANGPTTNRDIRASFRISKTKFEKPDGPVKRKLTERRGILSDTDTSSEDENPVAKRASASPKATDPSFEMSDSAEESLHREHTPLSASTQATDLELSTPLCAADVDFAAWQEAAALMAVWEAKTKSAEAATKASRDADARFQFIKSKTAASVKLAYAARELEDGSKEMDAEFQAMAEEASLALEQVARQADLSLRAAVEAVEAAKKAAAAAAVEEQTVAGKEAMKASAKVAKAAVAAAGLVVNGV